MTDDREINVKWIAGIFADIQRINSETSTLVRLSSEQIKNLTEKVSSPPTRAEVITILNELRHNLSTIHSVTVTPPSRQQINDTLINSDHSCKSAHTDLRRQIEGLQEKMAAYEGKIKFWFFTLMFFWGLVGVAINVFWKVVP